MQARLIYIQKYSTVEKFITNQDVRDIIYKSGNMSNCYRVLIFLLLLHHTLTIEIFDQKFGIQFTHTSGSHFGQSLSLYSYRPASGEKQQAILAGAPLESIPGAALPRTGNTLKCSIDLNAENVTNCEKLDLTSILSGNAIRGMGDSRDDYKEEKRGMLMGTSLYSSHVSGRIITCGHLYRTVTVSDVEHPVGLCHVLNGLNETSEILSPCSKFDCSQQADSPILNFGYCLAGFSATFFSLGEEVMLGGPGRGFFQGAGFKGDFADCELQTTPMDNLDRLGYSGYSVTTGRVLDRNVETIILSAPRSGLIGKIRLYSNKTENTLQALTLNTTVSGSYGGYLGYSLLTTDLDGDGLEEILASEPLYTDFDLRMVEVGRVVVFGINKTSNELEVRFNFTSPTPIPYSRFGHAITLIGDLDMDGHPEIAVSAPFTPQGGTVYIYRTTKNGSELTLLQTLSASDYMPNQGMKGFGFALSSQADVDDNGYEDLLIGAPLHELALLVRSHRLVRIGANFSSTSHEVSIKPTVPCNVVVNGMAESLGCFEIAFSFEMIGWPAPDWILLGVNVTLETKRVSEGLNPRGFFLEGETESIRIERTLNISQGESRVIDAYVYLTKAIFQLAPPLEFLAEYQVLENTRRDYFSTAVILDPIVQQSRGEVQLINLNCGSDNLCEPLLTLTASFSFANESLDSLTPGISRGFTINLVVANEGEEASRPKLRFQLDNEISFRNVQADILIDNTVQDGELVLQLGNSMLQGESYVLTVNFLTSTSIPDRDYLPVSIEFYSDVMASIPANATLEIPVKSLLQMSVSVAEYEYITTHRAQNSFVAAKSNPETEVDTVGSQSLHQYVVRNVGPYSDDADTSLLTVYWPLGDVLTDEYYLYLTQIQILPKEARCEQNYVNPLKFLVPSSTNRRRRDTRESPFSQLARRVRESIVLPDRSGLLVNCIETPHLCVEIQCFINPLKVGQTVSIIFVSNVYEPTLLQKNPRGVWNFTSYAKLEATSGADVVEIAQENVYVSTIVNVEENVFPPSSGPPWYIYVIPTVLLVLSFIGIAVAVLVVFEVFRLRKKYKEHKILHNEPGEADLPEGEES